uniref:Putative zinc-finger domain-containing protein n=1 Tax=uncultured Elusimicrobia bacterium TaxID=699876 RepID=A0A650ELL4_9BACT|nr:hypothetical protein Elusimicrob1349_1770 [uncultured Elusimicrobia bacterium]
MNGCEQILLYAQGELAGAEKAAFETHLASCPSCQKELLFLRRMDEALVPPAAPQSVVEGIFAKTTRKKSFFAGVSWKPALAGAAMLGLGIFVFLAGLQPDKTAFDAREVIAYMSENLDAEYLSFAEDLSAWEEDF